MQLIMAVPQINILECLFYSPKNQEIGVSSKQTTDHKKKSPFKIQIQYS